MQVNSKQQAESILKDCDIPSVPMVALKIIRLVDDPNTGIDKLQDAIMADQALSVRVLRLANSAFYGLSRNIDTITDAITIMGFKTIRNLALAASTKEVYKKFGLLEQKLWEHSIGASVGAGLIARHVRHSSAEEAMVAGLLHDIGKVVMNNSHPDRFLALTEQVYNEMVTYYESEETTFGYSHAAAGGIFAQKWGFPETLCNAIRRHHFESLDDLADLPPDARRLCCIVTLADTLCLRLGIGYRAPMPGLVRMVDECCNILGMDAGDLDTLSDTFGHEYIKEKLLYQA